MKKNKKFFFLSTATLLMSSPPRPIAPTQFYEHEPTLNFIPMPGCRCLACGFRRRLDESIRAAASLEPGEIPEEEEQSLPPYEGTDELLTYTTTGGSASSSRTASPSRSDDRISSFTAVGAACARCRADGWLMCEHSIAIPMNDIYSGEANRK